MTFIKLIMVLDVSRTPDLYSQKYTDLFQNKLNISKPPQNYHLSSEYGNNVN